MSARYEPIENHPGYYRHGNLVTFRIRDARGRRLWRSAPTVRAAERLKAELETDVRRGDYRDRSRASFADYAGEWIESYAGRTRSGIREHTRGRTSISGRACSRFVERSIAAEWGRRSRATAVGGYGSQRGWRARCGRIGLRRARATTSSSSRASRAVALIPRVSRATCSSRPAGEPAWATGSASTRSDIRARRCSSGAAGMRCRCNGVSGIQTVVHA